MRPATGPWYRKIELRSLVTMKFGSVRVIDRDVVSAGHLCGQAPGTRIGVDDGRGPGYCVRDADAVALVVEPVPSDAAQAGLFLGGRFTELSFEWPAPRLLRRARFRLRRCVTQFREHPAICRLVA